MTTELANASTWSAAELSLTVPESVTAPWREHNREQMAVECSRLIAEVGDRQWFLADAFATICARAGSGRSDRVRSLEEFCGELDTPFDPKYAREFARIAIAVPPEKRVEFRCTFGHFQQLVRGASREGEALPDRIERIYTLAAQVDDEGLGVRAAARLARETAHSNGRQMEPPEEQPTNRQEELQNQRLAEETARREASEREVEALKASIAVLERDLETARAKSSLTDEEMSELLQALETEGYWQRRRWGLELLLAAQRLLAPDFDAERHLPDYLRRAVSVATRLAGGE